MGRRVSLNRFFTEAYECVYTSYVGECARVLFLSAVARAFKPGCQADVMVVLIGPQGAGKSMGIASLSPRPEWYADDLGCDLTEGKAGEGLQGKWLFEFSEFARVNRATLRHRQILRQPSGRSLPAAVWAHRPGFPPVLRFHWYNE